MGYKKPRIAASVCVFAKKENSFLLIRRLHEPFKAKFAFPGGFLDVGKEDLYQTAIRELYEETGIRINREALILIDVRSSPKRDPRDHVIDVGFLTVSEQMIPMLGKTDETIPKWIEWTVIDKMELAFDHNEYWQNVKNYLHKNLYT
jgi:ADP-ribose pyrophosphatase YjhB (NUDIX family)